MERLSLLGDYFDCQLYGGRLYLWTFHGSLQVYNYKAIIGEWVNTHHGGLGLRCKPYEKGESQVSIGPEVLQRFLLYERDYLVNEFPTGTEVLSSGLYESNAKGLFTCKVPMFSRYHEQAPVIKLCDIPLVYISGAQHRGIVCAAGSDGLFWLQSVKNKGDLAHISNQQTIRANFCTPGIYAQSSVGESYLLMKDEGQYESVIRATDLYPKVSGSQMTWCWEKNFYLAEDHELKVYEFVTSDQPMLLKGEISFFFWKGDFVSAGSSQCGTVVELDNAICLFEDWETEDGHTTIMGPVTHWRMYPRSKEFSSHVHIIFDDRLDIVVMNDDVKRWNESRREVRYEAFKKGKR